MVGVVARPYFGNNGNVVGGSCGRFGSKRYLHITAPKTAILNPVFYDSHAAIDPYVAVFWRNPRKKSSNLTTAPLSF